jgi:hypothetical protein
LLFGVQYQILNLVSGKQTSKKNGQGDERGFEMGIESERGADTRALGEK